MLVVLSQTGVDLAFDVRQTEGGVGPAVGIEDPPWDSLHVAGDRVSHQLDSSDQQTASQEQAGSNLSVIIMGIMGTAVTTSIRKTESRH